MHGRSGACGYLAHFENGLPNTGYSAAYITSTFLERNAVGCLWALVLYVVAKVTAIETDGQPVRSYIAIKVAVLCREWQFVTVLASALHDHERICCDILVVPGSIEQARVVQRAVSCPETGGQLHDCKHRINYSIPAFCT